MIASKRTRVNLGLASPERKSASGSKSSARKNCLSSLRRFDSTHSPSVPERNGRSAIEAATVAGPRTPPGSPARSRLSASSMAAAPASRSIQVSEGSNTCYWPKPTRRPSGRRYWPWRSRSRTLVRKQLRYPRALSPRNRGAPRGHYTARGVRLLSRGDRAFRLTAGIWTKAAGGVRPGRVPRDHAFAPIRARGHDQQPRRHRNSPGRSGGRVAAPPRWPSGRSARSLDARRVP